MQPPKRGVGGLFEGHERQGERSCERVCNARKLSNCGEIVCVNRWGDPRIRKAGRAAVERHPGIGTGACEVGRIAPCTRREQQRRDEQ